MRRVTSRSGSPAAVEGTVLRCGGCGALFLVETGMAVLPVVLDGVGRVYCACCHDFLGDRLTSPNLAHVAGYDEEGQRILSRVRFPLPSAARRRRDPALQARLAAAGPDRTRAEDAVAPPLFLAG